MSLLPVAFLALTLLLPEESHGPVLLVSTENGLEPVTGLARDQVVPIPLVSRSERVVRVARTPTGARLRVAAGSDRELAVHGLDLVWVPHRTDESVITSGAPEEPPWIATSARLPLDAGAALPSIARPDGVGVEFVRIELADRRPGERLLVFGVEGPGAWSPIRDPLVLDPLGENLVHVRPPARNGLCEWMPLDGWKSSTLVLQRKENGAIDHVELAIARAVARSDERAANLARATVGRLRSTERETRPGRSVSWPKLGGELDERRVLELEEARKALGTHDGAAITLRAGEALDLDLDVPTTTDASTTWTLLAHVLCDSLDASEPRIAGPVKDALFRDVTRDAGIEFVHLEGPDEQLDIRPTMGPGAAWGDVDGDGWNDLFLPQGGGREGSRVPTAKLYRNRGDGTFEDATARANLGVQGRGMGALFFDVDGDRDLDVFVANYGANKLYLNDGTGRFTDVTLAAGVPQDERWHAAVCAADYDRDGDLDLYVTSYLDYDPAKMPPADELGRYQREDPLEMLPFAFPGERKQLLRNDRIKSGPTDASAPRDPSQPNAQALSFRFTDVTDELHVADANGRGMQAIFWDFDQDGDQDLYVANDVSPNTFFRNEGDGTFKDISLATGLDDPRGSMGLAVGDVDGDLDEDLFVTNWQLESNALYVNNLVSHSSAKHRVATFRDQSVQAGLAQLSVGVTSWGAELADLDLDGDLDLVYANGYTSPDYESTGICVGQPSHLFLNDGTGKFTPAFELAGPDLAEPLPSRSLLACDYDQDGDLDLAITANNARARLLRNDARVRGKDGAVTGLAANRHWLGLRLRARGANRFAIGAEVRVEAGGRTLLRTLRAGTSYLGGNAPELHVGLGDASKVDGVRVRWPDGKTSTHAVSSVDAFVVLTEPE